MVRGQQVESPAVDSVGRLARSGARWTLGLTITRQVISVGSTAILARLLLPEDYGIIGMVTTFTAFLIAMSDLGMSWAVIQRKDLTMTQVHNVFWFNVVVGVLFAGITFAAAPLLADFYGVAEVTNVARVTAATFIIGSLATLPLTLMRRRLAFRPLTLMELATYLVDTLTAILLAFVGWDYWALVAQGVVSQTLRLVLAYVVSDYRPALPRRDPAMRGMLAFGGYLSLSTILNYVNSNLDNVLIGRIWGAEELGYYARAYFLMTLPMTMLTQSLAGVMQPALAALAHDLERMGAAYRKSIASLAFAGFPVAIGITVAAPEAVWLVYGPNWLPVVDILSWLSIAMLTIIISSTYGWLYVATGHGREMFFMRVGTVSISIAILAYTVQRGPVAVAAGIAAFGVIGLVPLMYLAHRVTRVSMAKTLRVVLPPLGCAAAMGVAAYAAGQVAVGQWDGRLVPTLAVKVVTGVVTYGLLALLFVRPWPLPQLERLRVMVASRLHLAGE